MSSSIADFELQSKRHQNSASLLPSEPLYSKYNEGHALAQTSPTLSSSSSNFQSPPGSNQQSPIHGNRPDASSYMNILSYTSPTTSGFPSNTTLEEPDSLVTSSKRELVDTATHQKFQSETQDTNQSLSGDSGDGTSAHSENIHPPPVTSSTSSTSNYNTASYHPDNVATGQAITTSPRAISSLASAISPPSPHILPSSVANQKATRTTRTNSVSRTEDHSQANSLKEGFKSSNGSSSFTKSQSNRQAESPIISHFNTNDEVSPPIPPRAAKHSHSRSSPTSKSSTRPAPLVLDSVGNFESLKLSNDTNSEKSGELTAGNASTIETSKMPNQLKEPIKVLSAPSTPELKQSSTMAQGTQKTQPSHNSLKSPVPEMSPSIVNPTATTPIGATFPSLENCTFNELKSILSEKLIQLSQIQAQNAQLWALVNKQRTMIFDLQKDLDSAAEQNEKYRIMTTKQQFNSPKPSLHSISSANSSAVNQVPRKEVSQPPQNQKASEYITKPKVPESGSLSPHIFKSLRSASETDVNSPESGKGTSTRRASTESLEASLKQRHSQLSRKSIDVSTPTGRASFNTNLEPSTPTTNSVYSGMRPSFDSTSSQKNATVSSCIIKIIITVLTRYFRNIQSKRNLKFNCLSNQKNSIQFGLVLVHLLVR